EQEYAGVPVRFYAVAGDDTAPARHELVERTLSTLRAAGYVLPPRLNVHLPRYHRYLNVGPVESNFPFRTLTERTAAAYRDGNVFYLDVEDGPLKITVEYPSSQLDSGSRSARFFPPDDLVLTSGLTASRPVGHTFDNPTRVADRLDDDALGVVLGALMSWR